MNKKTKTQEILRKYYGDNFPPNSDVYEAMKEYADWFAKKCLEKAAEQAVVFLPSYLGLHRTHIHVDKDSILNIELPDHD